MYPCFRFSYEIKRKATNHYQLICSPRLFRLAIFWLVRTLHQRDPSPKSFWKSSKHKFKPNGKWWTPTHSVVVLFSTFVILSVIIRSCGDDYICVSFFFLWKEKTAKRRKRKARVKIKKRYRTIWFLEDDGERGKTRAALSPVVTTVSQNLMCSS